MSEAIRDKLNGYEISGKRVFIKTKPTAFFLKGKYYNGTVGLTGHDKFTLLDDIDGPVTIYYIEILSPADIMDSRKKSAGGIIDN